MFYIHILTPSNYVCAHESSREWAVVESKLIIRSLDRSHLSNVPVIKESIKTLCLSILVSNVVILSPSLVPYGFECGIAIFKGHIHISVCCGLLHPIDGEIQLKSIVEFGNSSGHLNLGSSWWHESLH